MQPNNFNQQSFRNRKKELLQRRDERFQRKRRRTNELMEEENFEEDIEKLDYHRFYSKETKQAINKSLQMIIPAELPPLSLFTISLYRRAGRSVYQCKQFGSKTLDPHMTYQSLLMLGHTDSEHFGKYSALVKQFERDFSAYMSIDSKDIREMVIIAAGNKILGKEEDIINLISGKKEQFLWVAINHVYEGRLSSRYLLPFFYKKNQLAFKAFSELTNGQGDQSITILTEEDKAVDCLIDSLNSLDNICKMSLDIMYNIFGQGKQYWKLFSGPKLFEKYVELLIKGEEQIKLKILRMLSNFVFEQQAATAVLRDQNLFSLIIKMLSTSQLSIEFQKELLKICSFLVYKAKSQEVFSKMVNPLILDICNEIMEINEANWNNQELNLYVLQLVCGLAELGEKYPDENHNNLAAAMINSNNQLYKKILKLCQSNNDYISGLSYTIIEKITPNEMNEAI